VSLRGGADQIELTVRDRGAGFKVSETEGCGLGLTSMKERVRTVGGQLAIRSERRRGTTICAIVPLVEKASTTAAQPEPA
jgi:signal transduction histidine kinase